MDIFVIDDDPNVLEYLCFALRQIDDASIVHGFTSPSRAIEQLAVDLPQIVITDMQMPVVDGFGVLEAVKRQLPNSQVVFLTGHADLQLAVNAMKLGACDYVTKPVDPERLVAALMAARSKQQDQTTESTYHRDSDALRKQLETLTSETLDALVIALDAREHETNLHSLRVSAYCSHLAKLCQVSDADLEAIRRGSLLHDIGKIGIADNILLKPGPLTSDEWAIMRTHPEIGYRIVVGLKWLGGGDQIVLYHHEHFDGRGYPSGLAGEHIPIGARIFTVIDAFDALTTDRPYRNARPYAEALAEIIRCSGTQFDPAVVSAFRLVSEDTWRQIASAAVDSSPAKSLTIPAPAEDDS